MDKRTPQFLYSLNLSYNNEALSTSCSADTSLHYVKINCDDTIETNSSCPSALASKAVPPALQQVLTHYGVEADKLEIGNISFVQSASDKTQKNASFAINNSTFSTFQRIKEDSNLNSTALPKRYDRQQEGNILETSVDKRIKRIKGEKRKRVVSKGVEEESQLHKLPKKHVTVRNEYCNISVNSKDSEVIMNCVSEDCSEFSTSDFESVENEKESSHSNHSDSKRGRCHVKFMKSKRGSTKDLENSKDEICNNLIRTGIGSPITSECIKRIGTKSVKKRKCIFDVDNSEASQSVEEASPTKNTCKGQEKVTNITSKNSDLNDALDNEDHVAVVHDEDTFSRTVEENSEKKVQYNHADEMEVESTEIVLDLDEENHIDCIINNEIKINNCSEAKNLSENIGKSVYELEGVPVVQEKNNLSPKRNGKIGIAIHSLLEFRDEKWRRAEHEQFNIEEASNNDFIDKGQMNSESSHVPYVECSNLMDRVGSKSASEETESHQAEIQEIQLNAEQSSLHAVEENETNIATVSENHLQKQETSNIISCEPVSVEKHVEKVCLDVPSKNVKMMKSAGKNEKDNEPSTIDDKEEINNDSIGEEQITSNPICTPHNEILNSMNRVEQEAQLALNLDQKENHNVSSKTEQYTRKEDSNDIDLKNLENWLENSQIKKEFSDNEVENIKEDLISEDICIKSEWDYMERDDLKPAYTEELDDKEKINELLYQEVDINLHSDQFETPNDSVRRKESENKQISELKCENKELFYNDQVQNRNIELHKGKLEYSEDEGRTKKKNGKRKAKTQASLTDELGNMERNCMLLNQSTPVKKYRIGTKNMLIQSILMKEMINVMKSPRNENKKNMSKSDQTFEFPFKNAATKNVDCTYDEKKSGDKFQQKIILEEKPNLHDEETHIQFVEKRDKEIIAETRDDEISETINAIPEQSSMENGRLAQRETISEGNKLRANKKDDREIISKDKHKTHTKKKSNDKSKVQLNDRISNILTAKLDALFGASKGKDKDNINLISAQFGNNKPDIKPFVQQKNDVSIFADSKNNLPTTKCDGSGERDTEEILNHWDSDTEEDLDLEYKGMQSYTMSPGKSKSEDFKQGGYGNNGNKFSSDSVGEHNNKTNMLSDGKNNTKVCKKKKLPCKKEPNQQFGQINKDVKSKLSGTPTDDSDMDEEEIKFNSSKSKQINKNDFVPDDDNTDFESLEDDPELEYKEMQSYIASQEKIISKSSSKKCGDDNVQSNSVSIRNISFDEDDDTDIDLPPEGRESENKKMNVLQEKITRAPDSTSNNDEKGFKSKSSKPMTSSSSDDDDDSDGGCMLPQTQFATKENTVSSTTEKINDPIITYSDDDMDLEPPEDFESESKKLQSYTNSQLNLSQNSKKVNDNAKFKSDIRNISLLSIIKQNRKNAIVAEDVNMDIEPTEDQKFQHTKNNSSVENLQRRNIAKSVGKNWLDNKDRSMRSDSIDDLDIETLGEDFEVEYKNIQRLSSERSEADLKSLRDGKDWSAQSIKTLSRLSPGKNEDILSADIFSTNDHHESEIHKTKANTRIPKISEDENVKNTNKSTESSFRNDEIIEIQAPIETFITSDAIPKTEISFAESSSEDESEFTVDQSENAQSYIDSFIEQTRLIMNVKSEEEFENTNSEQLPVELNIKTPKKSRVSGNSRKRNISKKTKNEVQNDPPGSCRGRSVEIETQNNRTNREISSTETSNEVQDKPTSGCERKSVENKIQDEISDEIEKKFHSTEISNEVQNSQNKTENKNSETKNKPTRGPKRISVESKIQNKSSDEIVKKRRRVSKNKSKNVQEKKPKSESILVYFKRKNGSRGAYEKDISSSSIKTDSDGTISRMDDTNTPEMMINGEICNTESNKEVDTNKNDETNEFTFSDILSQTHTNRLKKEVDAILDESSRKEPYDDTNLENVDDNFEDDDSSSDYDGDSDDSSIPLRKLKVLSELDNSYTENSEAKDKKKKLIKMIKGSKSISEIHEKLNITKKDELKEKIQNLVIKNPYPTQKIHEIAPYIARHLSKEQKRTLKQKGIEFKLGYFSEQEDKKIRKNWKKFCQLHDWDVKDYELFIKSTEKSKYGALSMEQIRSFVQFLSHDLENRTLNTIYSRFQTIFSHKKQGKGRFTKLDDKIILEYMKTIKSDSPYEDIATILNRSSGSILKRHRLLRVKNDQPKLIWNKDLAEELLVNLIEVTCMINLMELKDHTVTSEEWSQIGERMKLPATSIKRSWLINFYPRFFTPDYPEEKAEITRKLIDLVSSKYSNWREIDWTTVSTELGLDIPGIKCCKILSDLVRNNVPPDVRSNFDEALKYLKGKKYFPLKEDKFSFVKEILKETKGGTVLPKTKQN